METIEDQTSLETSPSSQISDTAIAVGDKNIVLANSVLSIIKGREQDLFYTPQKPKIFFNPGTLNDIIGEIHSKRVIVLCGGPELRNDRNQLSRKLAYLLQQSDENRKILEWRKNTDTYDIPSFLSGKNNCIYILNELSPRVVHYDLSEILKVAQDQSHFLIITTNQSSASWEQRTQPHDISYLFKEITSEQLYRDDYLAVNLAYQLHRSQSSLPYSIRNDFNQAFGVQIDTDSESDYLKRIEFPLSQNRSIKNVAAEMRNYDDIVRFVRFITADEKKLLSNGIIDEIIFKIKSTDKEFLRWYYNVSDKRDRHLLLGITLFSGLYENQLFTAIEELVENEWRTREPFLDAFDYEELDRLMDYAVDFIETGEIERKIEIKPKLQKIVFGECWQTQQRLLINSIQGMMNIVKNAIFKQSLLKLESPRPIDDEAIEKLRQLEIPPYILEKLSPLKEKTFTHWFELIESLQDAIGMQTFQYFSEKLNILFAPIGFLHFLDDEFREISNSTKNSQLYESAYKIKLIYKVVGATLQQIAFESLSLAEKALFEYAAEPNFEMRNIAALSLAQWRERHHQDPNREQQLFEILNRWHNEPEKVLDPSVARLTTNQKSLLSERKECYHSTVILAIGYASTYDETNKCSEELFQILRDFVPALMDEEKDPIKGLVEEALGNITTPLLMKYHLDQLHENGMLYNLMRYETGAKNIPFELSLIYITKPYLFNDIIEVIDYICKKLKRMSRKHQKKVNKFLRKGKPESEIEANWNLKIYPKWLRLKSIQIATYGLLTFTEGDERLTSGEVFQRLTDIFMDERDLRFAVADAVRSQIEKNFPALLREIKTILPIFDYKHYLKIIPGFYPRIEKEKKDKKKELDKEKKKAEEAFALLKKQTLLRDKQEFDEEKYQFERYVTNTERELFNWILKGGYSLRFVGFLAIFGSYLAYLEKENNFEEVLVRQSFTDVIIKLLISPLLFFFGPRIPIILFQLLPTVTILDDIYKQDLNDMLKKSWSLKFGKRKIRKLGFAFRSALYLFNNFFILMIIYFIIFIVIYSIWTKLG